MRSSFVLAVLFLAVFCSPLLADQLVLKNGDRITGTVTKSDAKTLLLKTEFMGDVTIQWSAVDSISSTHPLHVQTQNGKTLVGSINTSDGNFAVTSTTGETVSVAKAEVTALRNDQEQTAYDKSMHPSLLQGWSGGANVGFALTRGNSETKNLALAFTADRKTTHDEIDMYANSVYSTNDAAGATPSVTANTIQSGARYSRNFTKVVFGFGGADFQTDELQGLNLRSVLGGGLGVHLINTSRTTLDLLGGLNYTRENYVGLDRQFCRFNPGRGVHAQARRRHGADGKGLLFPRPESHRTISRHFQLRHSYENQQMAGVAECLRRYLCDESAVWQEAQRPVADHRTEYFIHPLMPFRLLCILRS